MHICIVGAGPVGLLQSLYLVKHHDEIDSCLRISIFERRGQQDLMNPSTTEQRSINLALSWRGMRALEGVGLLQEVLKNSIPMHGRFIHPLNGKCYIQPYSSHPDQVIYSIERVKIQKILLKAVLDHCITGENVVQIKINFRQQLVRYDPSESVLDFSTIKTVKADMVLGCDGTFSRVRTEMAKHFPSKVVQETFQHQYREFRIPVNDAKFVPLNYLHIWPREEMMLIALPDSDGSFTATLFCEFDKIKCDPVQFFEQKFPDFIAAVGVNRIIKDWQNNPVNKLVTVQVDPLGIDKIVLIGDSGHSILPFYGQGMNCGFEDVQLFTKQLSSMGPDAIGKYSAKRIPDVKAIDLLARQNYNEMRSQVLNPIFLYKSKALQLINKFLPDIIIPRYSMISFTSIPYSAIKRREIIQDVAIIIIAIVIIAIVFMVFVMMILLTTF